MRAGSAKRRPSNSLRTRKSRYSVNPAMSRAAVRRAKRRVRQNFARLNIRRILLCYGALAVDCREVRRENATAAMLKCRPETTPRCRSDERLQQARGHAGRLLWNRIVFYSTKGLFDQPGLWLPIFLSASAALTIGMPW